MRKKQLQLVVTFQSTAQAMAFEDAATQDKLPGRLIPTPTQITAGCGLAWRTDISVKNNINKLVASHKLHCIQIVELELYMR